MIPSSWLALAACCCALPAAALLTRPDRDDAEYLELATHYPSSVSIPAAGGEGVLVAPRWVLTTERAVRELQKDKARKISIGGSDMEVVRLDVREGLGLIGLKAHVRGIPHTPLYRGAEGEAGQTVVIVAHGGAGRKRAAINTIDAVSDSTLRMRIKPLDEASDLQGALVPAEMGAAAYLKTADGLSVAGIAISTDGATETYARISAYRAWIDATMLKLADEEAAALLGEK